MNLAEVILSCIYIAGVDNNLVLHNKPANVIECVKKYSEMESNNKLKPKMMEE